MKTPSSIVSVVFASVLLVLLAVQPAASTAASTGANLDAERARGEKLVETGGQLVQTLQLQEVLGPLAPIALSPFFALTCMSGASLLADSGILPDALANNALLGKGSALNNGFVFAGLLVLTLVTAAPKFFKVTKPLGQAIDQLEAYSGIIAIVAVQYLSKVRFGGGGDEVAVVVEAGIFSFTLTTLVAAFSVINIFVVNTVKFFFEVLVFLSPIPAVDAAFEVANKTVTAFLVALAVAYPWLAMVLNLMIFAMALLIFGWVYRRVVYMRCVLGDPMLGWLAENVFRKPAMTVGSTRLPTRVARSLGPCDMVLKAFAGRSYLGVKRKARGYLVSCGGKLRFVALRWFRAPFVVDLPAPGERVEVDDGLLSNCVRFKDATGETVMRVLFTRRYNDLLGDIRAALGADSAPVGEASHASAREIVCASGAVGRAVKKGARETLRAELA
jgi:hypothetical protein